ncbi:hypothetical protein J3R30DRAFT_575769 [Lentinula aciculospora]|uniref:Uncharacterized protein n=1 Tax=Lentinula aciculospora TaxID=153920 RepID=A0A9W9DLP5_9AGAR|nr:hypothetical protein J3R30DRAFT_575769 [Lentinula aciculospora]
MIEAFLRQRGALRSRRSLKFHRRSGVRLYLASFFCGGVLLSGSSTKSLSSTSSLSFTTTTALFGVFWQRSPWYIIPIKFCISFVYLYTHVLKYAVMYKQSTQLFSSMPFFLERAFNSWTTRDENFPFLKFFLLSFIGNEVKGDSSLPNTFLLLGVIASNNLLTSTPRMSCNSAEF